MIELARHCVGAPNAPLLHPSLGLMPAPSELRLRPRVLSRLPFRFARIEAEPVAGIPLPETYVAVRLYDSRHLRLDAAMADRLRALVEGIAHGVPVVVIEPGRQFDDHADLVCDGIRGVTVVRAGDPRSNLAVQTSVMQGARAVVATCSGMTLLATLLGRPGSRSCTERTGA